MEQQVTNFARFYTALAKTAVYGDRDEFKRSLVEQYTSGRTDSLKEITRTEYNRLCEALEGQNGYRDTQRKERSATLKLMQTLGIDTTDWRRINALTSDPRIMGKPFASISPDEHRDLRRKLRVIGRKGGFARKEIYYPVQATQPEPKVMVINYDMTNNEA